MDEKVENCAPPEGTVTLSDNLSARPGQDAKIMDRSDFEIIAVSDCEAYFNGSMKYLRKVQGEGTITSEN